MQSTGGSSLPGTDCTGELVFRFTAEYLTEHGVAPGEQVFCQFLSREPHFPPPGNLMLSDALAFTVVP